MSPVSMLPSNMLGAHTDEETYIYDVFGSSIGAYKYILHIMYIYAR